MIEDDFALLDHGLAVGAREQREQHDVVAEHLAQALEIPRKGGLGGCRIKERRRLFVQEGGEAADKKTETHGCSFVLEDPAETIARTMTRACRSRRYLCDYD